MRRGAAPTRMTRADWPSGRRRCVRSPRSRRARRRLRSHLQRQAACVARLRMRRGGTRRWIISALSVLAVVAVIVVVVVNIMGNLRSSGASAKPMLRINSQGDGLNCVSQIAWSPDGKEIAALGNLQNCGGSSSVSQTGVVYIYSATTGKMIEKVLTDRMIFHDNAVAQLIASHTNASSQPTVLIYLSLTWTPEGQSLLLSFNLDIPANRNGAPDTSASGLLRVHLSHTASANVWLDHYIGVQVGDFERWDLTTGQSVQAPQPAAAVAYRWGSGGALLPVSAPSNGALTGRMACSHTLAFRVAPAPHPRTAHRILAGTRISLPSHLTGATTTPTSR